MAIDGARHEAVVRQEWQCVWQRRNQSVAQAQAIALLMCGTRFDLDACHVDTGGTFTFAALA
jgi:hypothetical protein